MRATSTDHTLTALGSDGVHLSVSELVRYQQFTRLLDLTPQRMPQARLSGGYLTRHKGRGMEFDEARHYQPGDDIRAIDWRVTARTGKTHTKIYREERERPVFILCDLSTSMQFGTQLLTKAVQAAHVTALVSWAAASRGDKVGALLFAGQQHRECKPLSRKRAVLAICHELITLQGFSLNQQSDEQSQAEGFTDVCARARRLARPGSLVYLISDFHHLTANAQQHISQLARHCEVNAVTITDPMEHALPDTGITQSVNVTDGSNLQTWLLGDKKEQQQYRQWRAQHNQRLTDFFARAKVSQNHVSAGASLDEQLAELRRRPL
ncbi:DUF58 domain-containing protein [Alteromonas sp. ASW11-19]|uniref:DUF58 domain-containing protein n=1 Tax=Alteromonas salexigens TaxID=2982530 RepID=A0ABT2VPC5_9ALTE|nr:DUF58 domain-containing protein [Alteromonas salexigens]MCU7555170.1 DUF58 domain-containing protein [Alteromonas salexigens]